MRTTAGPGAASSPACCADHVCGCGGPGGGFRAGFPAGGRAGPRLRRDAHPAPEPAAGPSGFSVGPAVLAGGHGGPVSLVPGRLGRPGPGVRGGVLPDGRRPLFLGDQPLAAEAGLSGSRSGGRFFGYFDLSAGPGPGGYEKNQKNYKKHLPFRGEMV